MKKNVVKIIVLFAVVAIVTLNLTLVNGSSEKDTSLALRNMAALADGEGSGDTTCYSEMSVCYVIGCWYIAHCADCAVYKVDRHSDQDKC
jgi:hypothetical protein